MATTDTDQSDDTPQKISNCQIVNEIADDYAEYMKLDVSKEKQHFDESVEAMLTRLDEYCGLVDTIRSDTSLCLHKTLPEIYRKSAELEVIFQKIDALEVFVSTVKQNLSDLEEHVNRAEDDMGSFSSIKKMFSSFPSLLSKKSASKSPVNKQSKYVPLDIFSTEDYLVQDVENQASKTETKISSRDIAQPQTDKT